MQRSPHRIKQDHKRQAQHNKKVHAQKLKVTAMRTSLASMIAARRQQGAKINLQGLHDRW